MIKIDTDERKIGLTLIQTHFEEGSEATPSASAAAEPETAAAAAATMPMLGSLADQLKGIGARVSEREADVEPEASAADAPAADAPAADAPAADAPAADAPAADAPTEAEDKE